MYISELGCDQQLPMMYPRQIVHTIWQKNGANGTEDLDLGLKNTQWKNGSWNRRTVLGFQERFIQSKRARITGAFAPPFSQHACGRLQWLLLTRRGPNHRHHHRDEKADQLCFLPPALLPAAGNEREDKSTLSTRETKL